MIKLTPRMKRLHLYLDDTPRSARSLSYTAHCPVNGSGRALLGLEDRGMAGRCWDEKNNVWLWYRAELPQ